MPEEVARNAACLSASIRHLISHKNCCPCTPCCACKKKRPRKQCRLKEKCGQDKSCPQRIEVIALPLLRRVDYTLARYGPHMGAEMVVKMCRLVHELRFPQPKAANFFQAQPKKKRRRRRKPRRTRKEEKTQWLREQACKSSRIFQKHLAHVRDFIPTYKQLQVSMKLFASLNLRKVKAQNRFVKPELKRICDKLAILIDIKLEPYKQSLQVQSASKSTLQDKHCVFNMFEFEYKSETETIEMSEEEEEETFVLTISTVSEEELEGLEGGEEEESLILKEEEEEGEVMVEEEEVATEHEEEEEEKEGEEGEGEKEEGEELVAMDEEEEEEEGEGGELEKIETKVKQEGEEEEEEEGLKLEEEEEVVAGGIDEWAEEEEKEVSEGIGEEEAESEIESERLIAAIEEEEEGASFMEGMVEGAMLLEEEEESIQEVPEAEAHPEGTSSYIDWCLYVSWLREFGNNMEMYAMCLQQFRCVVLRGDLGEDTKMLQFLLRNWSNYLADSRQIDAEMTQYFKEKPITVCSKCGDCTIDDYPSDHYIPPELEAAIVTTKTWRKLLAEAEDYCRQLCAEEEAAEEAELAERELYEIYDVSSSSSSSYVLEQLPSPAKDSRSSLKKPKAPK